MNQSDPAYASELNELSGQTVWRVPHSSIFSEYSLNIPNDSQVLAVLLITFADYWSHGGRIDERDVTSKSIAYPFGQLTYVSHSRACLSTLHRPP